MSNSIILCGTDNTISGDSSLCTIINGANNKIENKTNCHIIGSNITAAENDTFYVGCNLHILGDVFCNNIYSEGDVVIDYSSSDERLKENINPLTGCLDTVLNLNPVEFDWNDDQTIYKGHDIGLIAQQVRDVVPEIVGEKKNGYLGIKYEKIIPILIGATKEQDKKIKELEEKFQEFINQTNC